MKRRTLSMMCVVSLFGIGLTGSVALADPDERQSVTVAFGRGLNTAQRNNSVNHVILPDDIKIKQGGVVQFLVAGFHQPVVFVPGIDVGDIMAIKPFSDTFIFNPDPTKPKPPDAFYFGINPAGGNPPTQATPANPIVAGSVTTSNASNRLESVGFPATQGIGNPISPKAEPGVYLVICNVAGHFNDGMFAYVKVLGAKGDN